jgi:hypothetical protein
LFFLSLVNEGTVDDENERCPLSKRSMNNGECQEEHRSSIERDTA